MSSDIYDNSLANRVRDFQRDHRLDVDGLAGRQTQIIINSLLAGEKYVHPDILFTKKQSFAQAVDDVSELAYRLPAHILVPWGKGTVEGRRVESRLGGPGDAVAPRLRRRIPPWKRQPIPSTHRIVPQGACAVPAAATFIAGRAELWGTSPRGAVVEANLRFPKAALQKVVIHFPTAELLSNVIEFEKRRRICGRAGTEELMEPVPPEPKT